MKQLLLPLFLLACFQISLGDNTNPQSNLQASEQINSKFVRGANPIRYRSNILIQLQGNPSKIDSLIFKELVDTLNVLIESCDVHLIPNGTSNLIVEINTPGRRNSNSRLTEQRDNTSEIIKTNVVLILPEQADYIARKKAIYFYLIRSLAVFRNYPSNAKVTGSVFTETDPDKITFHPIDFKIIKASYSYEFNTESEKKSNDWSHYVIVVLSGLIGMVISLIYLIIISQKGLLKKHHYEFGKFLKQGILVFVAFPIYYGIKTVFQSLLVLNSLSSATVGFGTIIVISLLGFISIVGIFFIERITLKGKENFMLGILVPFLSTMFVPILGSFLFLFGFKHIIEINSSGFSFLITTSVVSFTSIIGIARAFYIFMNKQSDNIIKAKDVELAQMGELHKQAELQSLRAKINPHFLYNALNSIASLATTDAQKTEQMALALSDFFKYAINREQKQFNSLSEELNAIRTYLEIEKVRFGDRLNFEIDCEPTLFSIQIPQLLIQPLVENAIKYGLSQITENGLIRIVITKDDHQINIRVYDNGPAFPDGPLTGFGIRNTQERIVLLYGSKASISWNNQPQKYIELSLPFGNECVKKD